MIRVEDVVEIAREAGRAILRIYDEPKIDAVTKADGSSLTVADALAQEIILAALQRVSALPIISEETPVVPYSVRRDWSSFWLVDPLDGTREFLARNGEFTVNIALVQEGCPVLGVVRAPALARTYWAVHGHAAFVCDDGELPKRIVVRDDACALTVAVSRSHGGDALGPFLDGLGPHTLVRMGSSLKFCLVADGSAQFYPRLGPTFEWDTAAAHCIVTQAGGTCCDFEGNALLYNKPDLRNPWCFAAASARVRELALERASMEKMERR